MAVGERGKGPDCSNGVRGAAASQMGGKSIVSAGVGLEDEGDIGGLKGARPES